MLGKLGHQGPAQLAKIPLTFFFETVPKPILVFSLSLDQAEQLVKP